MGLTENIQNLEKIKASYDKYIVKPLNAFGVGGSVFNVDKATTVRLLSDITDNYVEDNSAVQDHIALRPITLTIGGYVGELSYTGSNNSKQPVQELAQKLTTVSSYLTSAISSADKIKQSISAGKSAIETFADVGPDIFSLVKNINPAANKQTQAYLYYKALWQQKILSSIQTPFEFLTNMAIQSVVALQDEDTKQISEFTITFKQIRTTALETIPFSKDKYQSRALSQRAELQDQGKIQGTTKELLVASLANFVSPL